MRTDILDRYVIIFFLVSSLSVASILVYAQYSSANGLQESIASESLALPKGWLCNLEWETNADGDLLINGTIADTGKYGIAAYTEDYVKWVYRQLGFIVVKQSEQRRIWDIMNRRTNIFKSWLAVGNQSSGIIYSVPTFYRGGRDYDDAPEKRRTFESRISNKYIPAGEKWNVFIVYCNDDRNMLIDTKYRVANIDGKLICSNYNERNE